MSARTMQVIVTNLERRGKGVSGDPIRRLTQYWSVEGELLAEVDPCQPYLISKKAEDRVREIYRKSVIEHGDVGAQLDEYTTKLLTKEILNTLGIAIEGVNV